MSNILMLSPAETDRLGELELFGFCAAPLDVNHQPGAFNSNASRPLAAPENQFAEGSTVPNR
jgi:hypothetical protein